jgi:hypothetical protein
MAIEFKKLSKIISDKTKGYEAEKAGMVRVKPVVDKT